MKGKADAADPTFMKNDQPFAERRIRTAVGLLLTCLFLLPGCASLIAGDLARGGNPHYEADRVLAGRIERRLASDSVLHHYGIRASVYQGVATLTGRVATVEEQKRATSVAARVPGVGRVVSRIILK
jgi:hypothetical protein